MEFKSGKYKLDEYDMILEEAGYGIKGNLADVEEDVDVDNDSLTKLMEEIGIKRSNDGDYTLVLHNDEVNDMIHVVLALYEICGLNNEEAMKVMMEAHNKGKAVAKSGSEDEMIIMKSALNNRGIESTVEN